ncbi:MAG: NUDIX domain-containing protein [Myxococcota bacterium]
MSSIRIAIVLIENAEGLLFAHRRRADKRIFPSLWGLGAGGRIEASETPREGAQRELGEEAGLTAAVNAVEAFPFENGGVTYEVHVFAVRADRPIVNHDEEWSECGWFSRDEVARMIDAGVMCPDTAEAYRRWR